MIGLDPAKIADARAGHRARRYWPPRFCKDRRAVTALEYALISAITTMVILTGLAVFDSSSVIPEGKITGALGNANAGSSNAAPIAASPAASPTSSSAGAAPCPATGNCPAAQAQTTHDIPDNPVK